MQRFLFSSGRVLGLEWSLHRHGEHSEEDKDGDRRRRIELRNGNCHKNNIKKLYYKNINKIINNIETQRNPDIKLFVQIE